MKLIWGLDSQYMRHFSTITETDIWFGNRTQQPRVNFDTEALFKGCLDELRVFSQQGLRMPMAYIPLFCAKLDHYMDLYEYTSFGRSSDYAARRNQLFLLGHFFYTLLMQSKPVYAFFSMAPHNGIDDILADLCIYLGIPVYYCLRSPIADTFFIVDDQYQLIKPVRGQEAALPALSAFLEETELNSVELYAERWKRYESALPKHSAMGWLDLLTAIVKYPLRRISGVALIYYIKYIINRVCYQKYLRAMIGLSGTTEHVTHQLTQSRYVYFPLVFQAAQDKLHPSTVSNDHQAAVVDDILRALPQDWMILVKEHPQQDWQYRSTAFWRQMMSDPRVLLVHSSIPDSLLIKHSQLLVTACGITSWQALKSGKPVVQLGHCWSTSLHGVFTAEDLVNLNEIARFKMNNVMLTQSLQMLLGYAWQGVVNPVSPLKKKDSAAYGRHVDALLKALPLPSSKLSF